MPEHDIIVVGASAGGVEALGKLVSALPPDLPAAVFIVLHIPAQSPSLLPEILSRSGSLLATHPTDGEKIQPGHIYVAPPDLHLMVEQGRIRLTRGPKENRHRPAIDVLFRSAALAYGSRVIGVILTGSLDDGTAGLLAIKRQNGMAVIQNPHEAMYPSMPQSAMAHVQVDYCLPLAEIGQCVSALVRQPAPVEHAQPAPKLMETEVKFAEMDMSEMNNGKHVGVPSAFSCPECGGVLWELHDGELLRFRCRVGHAYSIESMLAGQSEALETALWVALETLEETISLSRRIARDAEARDQHWLARRYQEKMQEAQKHADVLRRELLKNAPLTSEEAIADALAITREDTVPESSETATNLRP